MSVSNIANDRPPSSKISAVISDGRGHGWRLPAKELEEAVFDVVRLDPAFAKIRQRAG